MGYITREDWLDCIVDLDKVTPAECHGMPCFQNLSVSETEVKEIFFPLAAMIWRQYRYQNGSSPMIVGIAGSVAAGKSTYAQVLSTILSSWGQSGEVSVLSTDNFLFPNHVLESIGLMHHKGFPDSFDQSAMQQCFLDIKAGRSVSIPVYSHKDYDVQLNQYEQIKCPRLVMVEGVNAIHLGYSSSHVDLGIFIEAPLDSIKVWFMARAKRLVRTSWCSPSAYFHGLSGLYPEQLDEYLSRVWEEVNLENYHHNIVLQKESADWVVDKQHDHTMRAIWLKR